MTTFNLATAPDTLSVGTRVSWHYRSAIGHGTIVGIHKAGTTHATTEYSIREVDHHVSQSGSKEKAVVFHFGSALTVSSGKSLSSKQNRTIDLVRPGDVQKWRHGWIPITPTAVAEKEHKTGAVHSPQPAVKKLISGASKTSVPKDVSKPRSATVKTAARKSPVKKAGGPKSTVKAVDYPSWSVSVSGAGHNDSGETGAVSHNVQINPDENRAISVDHHTASVGHTLTQDTWRAAAQNVLEAKRSGDKEKEKEAVKEARAAVVAARKQLADFKVELNKSMPVPTDGPAYKKFLARMKRSFPLFKATLSEKRKVTSDKLKEIAFFRIAAEVVVHSGLLVIAKVLTGA